MKKPVLVLGAGSWGTALAFVLARNNVPTFLWGHNKAHMQTLQKEGANNQFLNGYAFPENLQPIVSIEEAIDKVEDILIVVPSHGFHDLLSQLTPLLAQSNVKGICWATKGLDQKTGRLLTEVVEDQLAKDYETAILSGPSFAKEVAKGLPTAVVLASEADSFKTRLETYFHCRSFRTYHSSDLIGVQIGGLVKNVLAIAAGISDGLGFGANAQSALITRGLAEMVRLGTALGAKPDTFMGLSGMGDLILTCTDNQSRNRRFGLALGQGKNVDEAETAIGQVVEGKFNAKDLTTLAKQHQIDMPICQTVHAVIEGEMTAKQAVEALLARAARAEG